MNVEANPTVLSERERAEQIAAKATSSPHEQAAIVKNLIGFPPELQVRGVFFEGMARVITQARSPAALAELVRIGGTPERPVAFRSYPHRHFYHLYYLAARVLHPGQTFPVALRLVARDFFPIFRSSMLGKTMSAFMGTEPATILPLVSRAYNLSVSGNEHHAELSGARRVTWRCRVEPVEWYEETFGGIIEGTAPEGGAPTALKVATIAKTRQSTSTEYRFEITW